MGHGHGQGPSLVQHSTAPPRDPDATEPCGPLGRSLPSWDFCLPVCCGSTWDAPLSLWAVAQRTPSSYRVYPDIICDDSPDSQSFRKGVLNAGMFWK